MYTNYSDNRNLGNMHAGSDSQKSKYDGTQVLGNLPPLVTKRQNEPFLFHTQTKFLLSPLSQLLALLSQLHPLSS